MQRPATSARSFYQIAGIHGAPFVAYDGVGAAEDEYSQWGGYCWHGSQLFPTWHRPYVMLLEQELRSCARELVETWRNDTAALEANPAAPAKLESFDQAAKELRFPYFDWGNMDTLKFGMPDELCSLSEVTAETPFQTVTIPNPLISFVMPTDVGDVVTTSPAFNPTNRPKYKVPPPENVIYTPKGFSTVRYPNSDYESQPYGLLYETLQDVALSFRPRLSYMFALDNWKDFSNHSTGATRDINGKKRGVSLEGVHDQVHNTFGGVGGHMQYPEVAGFDPIFFLHHCNVDRLLALWQPLEENMGGTWTAPAKTVSDELTALTPFRWREQKTDQDGKPDPADTDAFFTSKAVRHLQDPGASGKSLGYTYPELGQWKNLSPAEKLTKINEMYGASVNYNGYRLHADLTGISKRQLGGSFSINMFVGFPENVKVTVNTPTKDNPHFAGKQAIFASGPKSKCKNCKGAARQLLNGSVDLTSALLKVGNESGLGWSPEDLVPDESQGANDWTRPPKLTSQTSGDKAWEQIKEEVQKTIKFVAVNSDGTEAHHVSIDSVSVSWSRPYLLTDKQQQKIAAHAGPARSPAATAVTVPDNMQGLPAPVVDQLKQRPPPPMRAAALATEAPSKIAFKDVLFVALSPLEGEAVSPSV
eukprot:gene11637-11782_t